MVDFSKLRAKSGKAGLDEISLKLTEKKFQTNTNKDERFWFPKTDAAGNAFAIIRFLPDNSEDMKEYVHFYEHAFKAPATGKWYIEKNLKTIGMLDPCGEYINSLWSSGLESNKELARKIKVNNRSISNILVISDKAQPECEGKVFLYKYGKRILDKIVYSIRPNPEFEDEVPMNPFDVYEGGDFKIKVRGTAQGPNYDDSKFAPPSPVAKNDKELAKILEQTYDLSEFTNPANFKTYDELKKRFNFVMGFGESSETNSYERHTETRSAPDTKTKKPVNIPVMEDKHNAPWDDTASEDGDDMDFLKNLADE